MASINTLPRVFKWNQATLPDPNPNIPPKEVAQIYSNEYPELTTAHINGPTIKDGKAVYTFETSFKPKG